MYIGNNGELKEKYRIINFINDLPQNQKQKLNDYVIELKRSIRNYYRKQEEKNSDIINVFHADIDGYIKLKRLPYYIKTMEEAVEYFLYNEYIEPTYSYHDCTGRPFTSWYKIIKRNDRFYVYHRICFDV